MNIFRKVNIMLDICKSCEVFNEVNDDCLCEDCNKPDLIEVVEEQIEELEIVNESQNVCECCDAIAANLVLYNTMNMCPECYKKELALEEENASHADERVAEVRTHIDSEALQLQVVNTTIQVREDFFNAKTLSIIEMKAQIEQDHSIERKHFALSERLLIQYKHLKDRVFKRQEENVKDTSTMRSIQQYVNEHANKLRTGEREKLKIEDINYKPSAPKKAKTPKVKKAKFDKKELKKYSDLLGGGVEYTLQMLCVAQNLQPDGAYKVLKELQGKS